MKGVEDPIVKAYHEYMVDLAVILGAERTRAEAELFESLNFEIALANVHKKIYHLVVIDQNLLSIFFQTFSVDHPSVGEATQFYRTVQSNDN